MERQFYGQESNISGTTSSSYYYNVSPNRISVDARFNIVLNTPGAANQEVAASFENFSSYAQYGDGAYMPIPETGNYYSHQYVDMLPRVESAQNAQQPVQEVYSNIPIINSIPNEANAMSNFYYNEFAAMIPHTNNSVLKELPKAETMVVQKGNVLEIVPSNELPVTVSTNTTANQNVAVEEPKSCPAVSWKEEVNNRHVTAAVLRLSRENESGIMRSILKKSEQATEVKKEEYVHFCGSLIIIY